MITITISDIELYDNTSEEFVTAKGGVFRFEHSLESITKWESEWEIPFLNAKLTNAQLMHYYQLMCVDEGLTREHITPQVVEALSEYMGKTQTATTFQNEGKGDSRIMTSEVIYAMMAAAQVPFECERWNIHKLLVLLRVISANNAPPKKMSRDEILAQNARLNRERKAKMNTKG